MDNEFDFQLDQIDQRISVKPVPISLPQSLAGSRIIHHNFSTQQCSQTHQQSNQRNQEDLFSSRDFYEQEKKNTKKQIRAKQIQIDQQKKLMDQCTFKPKINSIKNKQKRGFNQFLQNQQAYSKKVKQKVEFLRKNKQNIESQQKIYSKSKAQTMKNSVKDMSVFDRLHSENKQKYYQKVFKKYNNNITFHPSISQKSKNIIREDSIDQYLYKDAKMRKMKKSHANSKKQIDQVQLPASHGQKNFSSKNQEYIGKKFMREFNRVVENLQFSDYFQTRVDLDSFVYILSKLGFLTMSTIQHLPSSQKQIVTSAYQLISNVCPNIFNIFTLLLAVIGLCQLNPLKLMDIDSQIQQEFRQILIIFNQNQSKAVHSKFQVLYRNRLFSQQKCPQSSQSQCSFTPLISPHSKYLAEKHRKLMLEQVSKYLTVQKSKFQSSKSQIEGEQKCQVITHPEYLLLNQKIKQKQLQIMRSVQEQRALKQCTFQPKVQKLSKAGKKGQQVKSDPILILDINFGGKDDQIIIKADQQDQLAHIAKFYADKHFIDEQSQAQLLSMLKQQFRSFFQQI